MIVRGILYGLLGVLAFAGIFVGLSAIAVELYHKLKLRSMRRGR